MRKLIYKGFIFWRVMHPSYKNIIKLSYPVMLGMLIHYTFSFADKFFISKLGIYQAGGHSVISTVLWVLFTFNGLVTGGTIALVSRKSGENNQEEFKNSALQSVYLAFCVGIVITLLSYMTMNLMFEFFNVKPMVEYYGKEYFKAFLPGYTIMYVSITMSVIFQASGDTKTPMYLFSFLSILNILLDPILIYGSYFNKPLGIKGGAYATVISEFMTLFYMFIVFKRKFKFSFFIKPDFKMMKRILKIGLWSGLSGFSRPVSGLFLHKIIAFYGTKAIVAFGFAIQWLTIAFVFFEGIKVAVSTLIGQYLGMKNFNFINLLIKRALTIGIFIIVFIVIITLFYADNALFVFSDDGKVIKLGASYLKIVMVSLIFNVPLTVYSAVFNGAGDTKPPMSASFIANWPIKIVMASITTYYLNLSINYVWYAVALSVITESAIIYFWYLKGNWRIKKI